MEIVSVRKPQELIHAVRKVTAVLKKGGVVVLPTDTVYGIAANIFSKKALQKLFLLKQRQESKPSPVFVRDLQMVERFAHVPPEYRKALRRVWPGPLTVVLKSKKKLSRRVSSGRTVAVRIPDHVLVRMLLRRLHFPVTGTSANLSGLPPCQSARAFLQQLEKADSRVWPDLVLDAGRLPERRPSTILDVTTPTPTILRRGQISKKESERLFDRRIALGI